MNDPIGDPHFDKGPMRIEKETLGDRSDWDPVFEAAIRDEGVHGVILVTAKGDPNNNFQFQV